MKYVNYVRLQGTVGSVKAADKQITFSLFTEKWNKQGENLSVNGTWHTVIIPDGATMDFDLKDLKKGSWVEVEGFIKQTRYVTGSGLEMSLMEVVAESCYLCSRICSHCGKVMLEGYYLAGEYACSDECAIALYNGDKQAFEADIANADDDDAEVYWTEWD